MHITNVTAYVLEQDLQPKDHFAFSQSWCRKRTILICRIDTNEGISGWGEAFGPAKIHKTIIDNYYREFLIGKDPFDTQFIWEHLYNMFRDSGQRGVTIQSLSAIDIALWDIKGIAVGRPVYQLMGGAFRDKLVPYATGMYRRYTENEISESTEEAISYIEKGFSAIKIKTGFGIDYDLSLVHSIRDAIGVKPKIMIDANHAYNATTAVEIGRKMEELDISWYEEPVPPEDHLGYQEVRSRLNIPISGGEAEFTRYGLQYLINNRCVDIVQPDCTITGGLSEFMKITTLCSIANTQCIPHVWGSGIALATGIQAAISMPDFPPSLEPVPVYLEYDQTANIFREELVEGIPEIIDGVMKVSNKPGLGIKINEELINRYSID